MKDITEFIEAAERVHGILMQQAIAVDRARRDAEGFVTRERADQAVIEHLQSALEGTLAAVTEIAGVIKALERIED